MGSSIRKTMLHTCMAFNQPSTVSLPKIISPHICIKYVILQHQLPLQHIANSYKYREHANSSQLISISNIPSPFSNLKPTWPHRSPIVLFSQIIFNTTTRNMSSYNINYHCSTPQTVEDNLQCSVYLYHWLCGILLDADRWGYVCGGFYYRRQNGT